MYQFDAMAGFIRGWEETVHLVCSLLDEIQVQVVLGFFRSNCQRVYLCLYQFLVEMCSVSRFRGLTSLLAGQFHQGARVEDIGIGNGHALHGIR